MSSPSVLFYQGLRCTKVRRQSAAVATPSTTLPGLLSASSSTSTKSEATPDPTQFVETSPSSTDSSTRSTSSHTSTTASIAETTSTQTTQSSSTGPLITATATISTSISSRSSASDAETHSKTHDPLSSDTSGSQIPSVTSHVSLRLSNSAALGSPTAPTTISTESLTSVSTITGSAPFESHTHPLQDPPGSPDGAGTQASLRTLLGSILGACTFIALIFLICFLLYRYRRKKSTNDWEGEKPRHHFRESADSSTSLYQGYRSGASNHSDTSSARSLYNYTTGPLLNTDHHSHSPQQDSPNPFLDSAEILPRTRGSTPGMEETAQDPFVDPIGYYRNPSRQRSFSRKPIFSVFEPAQHEYPRQPGGLLAPDDASIHSSEHSLGSTLILPGRSSAGSSIRRLSYQLSAEDLGLGEPDETVTRVSTRSDPFDLEVPARVVHQPGSSSLPGLEVPDARGFVYEHHTPSPSPPPPQGT